MPFEAEASRRRIVIAKRTSQWGIVTDDPDNWRLVAKRPFVQGELIVSHESFHVGVRDVEFVDVILEETQERKRVYMAISAVPSDAGCSLNALEFPWCFANHSCKPNLQDRWGTQVPSGLEDAVTIATRAIAEGEELTFDYALEYYDLRWFECLCGAAECRGSICGFGGLSREQQARLFRHASPFVQEKFRREANAQACRLLQNRPAAV